MSEDAGRLVGGRYRLGEVLGRGGMGTVWRGQDEILGRTVAVKELRFPSSVDEEEKQRLITRTLREAKAIARIRSGSAVTVFDVVNEDSRPWIVMELVEGHSLADKIKEDGPLEPQRAAEVGLAILDVLRAAHREGILHRDVKPSNVLLEDVTGRVVLTDFGIAKVEGDPSVTSTGMLVGAPSYISPERARGKPPGPPADLWSLGGLLFAAVEGRPPYDKGSAISTLTAVMTEPVPVSERAGELSEVIAGLLVKDPEKRLDVDGARVLLEPLAYGFRGGKSPKGAENGSQSTRTATLPPAPEPVSPASGSPSGGSSGGSGGRRKKRPESGSSADRLRGALKSVRNAAGAAGAGAAGSGSGTGNGSGTGDRNGNGTGDRNGNGNRAGSGTGRTGRGSSSGGAHAGGRRDGARSGASASSAASAPPVVPPVPSSPPSATPSFRKGPEGQPQRAGATGPGTSTPGGTGTSGTGAAGARTGAGGRHGSGEQPVGTGGSGSRALPPESGGSDAITSLRDLRELPELRKGIPRRVLAIGIAAVLALVVVIALIAAVANGDDKEGGSGKGSSSGEGAADGAGSGKGDKGGQEDKSGQDGGSGSGDQKDGEKPDKQDEAAKKPEKPALPGGYAKVTDGRFHFSMALPGGWKRTGIAGQNSGGKYSAPGGGYPRIQIDFNSSPLDDAAGAWRGSEPNVRGSSPGYKGLGIKTVGWRGYPTVADWEFTRNGDGGKERVLNRGFKVDNKRGYAIMITCKAGGWQDKACKTLRQTAFKTFKPTG
ncbi:serine/threonine-protein kinase [Streptomyces iconiensis]|uniref:non-specific serine/threonine protein kinase n=1 Tax=Streptomyces iconiensis TaxID=1384038 RepID=A0ABT7A5N6_9ACTN|nr:serine/threonine-protein kinase [Streptomyces iconiensis]MDJ1135943.1 serine/threonine-protein kinase [Streptomyces iconiensis]